MTRKHFTAIAETIRFLDLPRAQRRVVAHDMALTLSGFNGNFDRDRFIEACMKPVKGEAA